MAVENRPGMWFGEGVLICEKPRIISAVATTPCELAGNGRTAYPAMRQRPAVSGQ